MNRITRIVMVSVGLAIALGFVAVAESSPLVVSKQDGDYTRIQDAIDAADDGQYIIVQPGLYRENLCISKPLTLIGEQGVSLEPETHDHPVVSVRETQHVLIRGLSIHAATAGIELVGSSATVSGCSISASQVGLSVISFEGSSVMLHAINVQGMDAAVGVQILGTGTTLVTHCRLSGLATGIWIGGRATAVVTDCILESNYDGLSILNTTTIEILDSSISDNFGSGIRLSEFPDAGLIGSLTLVGNRILRNNQWGITLCGFNGTQMDSGSFRLLGRDNVLAENGEGETCPETVNPG